jgi:hypothetical protein
MCTKGQAGIWEGVDHPSLPRVREEIHEKLVEECKTKCEESQRLLIMQVMDADIQINK